MDIVILEHEIYCFSHQKLIDSRDVENFDLSLMRNRSGSSLFLFGRAASSKKLIILMLNSNLVSLNITPCALKHYTRKKLYLLSICLEELLLLNLAREKSMVAYKCIGLNTYLTGQIAACKIYTEVSPDSALVPIKTQLNAN